jgi:transcriptional regulator with XRE-family HTH domain
MSDHDDQLDGPKARAAYLLGTTDKTQADVAEECGVSAKTIQRWNAEPEFRRAILAETRRYLATMAGVAASRIRRMMRDARDRDVAPVLRLYFQALGLIGEDPAELGQVRGPVILPADSDEWKALGATESE